MFGLNKKKKANLGKPMINLTIELKCQTKTFEDEQDGVYGATVIHAIERYGKAISVAKTFKGKWHVTYKGYLLSSHLDGLPCHKATLIIDMDENINQLLIFEKWMQNNKNRIGKKPYVCICYKDGPVERLTFDDQGICLEERKRDYEKQIAEKKAKIVFAQRWLNENTP